jgi:hypothetical protein
LRRAVRQQLAAVQIGPDTFNDAVADIAPYQIAGVPPAAMMANGIIVQQLAKLQVHIGEGRVTFLTQATRIATSPPSATG